MFDIRDDSNKGIFFATEFISYGLTHDVWGRSSHELNDIFVIFEEDTTKLHVAVMYTVPHLTCLLLERLKIQKKIFFFIIFLCITTTAQMK